MIVGLLAKRERYLGASRQARFAESFDQVMFYYIPDIYKLNSCDGLRYCSCQPHPGGTDKLWSVCETELIFYK